MFAGSVPNPPLTRPLQELLDRFERGDRLALARAISIVENERPGFQTLLHHVLARGLHARRIGFTGPPGAGKSTLVSAIATASRATGEEVGVVAVDPTSPLSGGALLGDRIRMNELATDPGMFIRSMATRGSLGGLATSTKEVLDLMDGFGFPKVLVETVGVGQTELEIAGAADTTVVVLVPESGDGIQAMKAGLLEVADVFVINKADRPGADRLVKELRMAIHLRSGDALRDIPAHHGVDLKRVRSVENGEAVPAPPVEAWEIPVLTTVAQSGEGVPELMATLEAHRRHLELSGELERRRLQRASERVGEVVDRELRRLARRITRDPAFLAAGVDRIARGDETPYSLAQEVVAGLVTLR